jgi:hypothetical protein
VGLTPGEISANHYRLAVDVHYMAPSEDDLQRVMAKYTEWLDGQIANVSHGVNKLEKKGSQFS